MRLIFCERCGIMGRGDICWSKYQGSAQRVTRTLVPPAPLTASQKCPCKQAFLLHGIMVRGDSCWRKHQGFAQRVTRTLVPPAPLTAQHLGCFVEKGASNLIFICRGVGMADKLASDTSEEIHAGSSPVPCTNEKRGQRPLFLLRGW